jgi:hypothetical protein
MGSGGTAPYVINLGTTWYDVDWKHTKPRLTLQEYKLYFIFYFILFYFILFYFILFFVYGDSVIAVMPETRGTQQATPFQCLHTSSRILATLPRSLMLFPGLFRQMLEGYIKTGHNRLLTHIPTHKLHVASNWMNAFQPIKLNPTETRRRLPQCFYQIQNTCSLHHSGLSWRFYAIVDPPSWLWYHANVGCIV